MKRLLFVGLLSCALIPTGHSQGTDARAWVQRLNDALEARSSWSFDLEGEQLDESSGDAFPILSCHVDAAHDHSDIGMDGQFMRFTADSLWYADDIHGNCMSGPRCCAGNEDEIDVYRQVFVQELLGGLGYLRFWLQLPQPQAQRQLIAQAAASGEQHVVLLTEAVQTSKAYNGKTKKCDIPIYDTLVYHLDTARLWVCRVDAKRSWTGERNRKNVKMYRFYAKNLIVGETQHALVPIDFGERRYDGFRLYSFPAEIPSAVIFRDGAEQGYEYAKHFPLVAESGDTLNLCDTAGWKLIGFWSYSCGACIKHFIELRSEKEKNGVRFLEQAGISLFFINPYTGNTQAFRKFVEQYGMQDIGYSAHDMTCLPFGYTPYFYLFAPNGDLVFSGQPTSYSALLKAKRKYERRSHCKVLQQ